MNLFFCHRCCSAIFVMTLLLCVTTSVVGQGFPPGGGSSSQGDGIFDPLDDITINSITVSGTTGTIEYTLHDDYTETLQPLLTLSNPGGTSDTFNLTDTTAGTYSKEFSLQQPEGSFHIFLAYPLPQPNDERKGVGQSFTVEGGVVTVIDEFWKKKLRPGFGKDKKRTITGPGTYFKYCTRKPIVYKNDFEFHDDWQGYPGLVVGFHERYRTPPDYVFVCHSQGCNIAMHVLDRTCKK